MEFDLEHLRTFAAVIDGGTFESAARSLQLTPSAVSQRIKAMEQRLGRVILLRTKPAKATEAGEAILRLARQIDQLERDTLSALSTEESSDRETTRIPLVVNADSLSTWVLPALAPLAEHRLSFDLYREDEAHSTELLRAGTVMAAITSTRAAVQGCIVQPLGSMRYRAMATPAFIERWFADGVTADSLGEAPVVYFDRKDELQSRFIHRVAGRRSAAVQPPRHFVPASADFAQAVLLGFGWGMLPEIQTGDVGGRVVPLLPDAIIDVPLYWQRWKLDSALLQRVTDAVVAEAARVLRSSP